MSSQRIVQDWNSLSEWTVAATTLIIFKVAGNEICGTIGIERNPRQAQPYIPYFGIYAAFTTSSSVKKNQQLIFYLE